MPLRLLVLAALLVVLLLVDRGQRDAAAERREVALRVRTLVSAETRASRGVAVVRVQDAAGHADVYGRQEGHWRCLSWRGAPAQDARIDQLISGLYDAQGVVLSEHPEHPSDYGLDVPTMRVVSLHGPDARIDDPRSDLVLALEVGAPVVGADGCYARMRGERAIWTIDNDPGAVTGREPAGAVPHLVERAIVPASWPGEGPRIKTISVMHAGAAPFTLEMRPREVTPEEQMQGVPGFEWILAAGGAEVAAAMGPAMGFANHVLTAPWADVLDTALAAKLGFDAPRAEVSLAGGAGEPCRLLLGGRTPSGRSAVLNSASRTLFEIEAGTEALLFPQAAAFAPDATANPWERPAAGPPGLSIPPR